MALDSWDWFVKLAESKNFTRAAESLQISQQTLSARLATLEKNLDAKLVVRGNPLIFTNAGLVFLAFAREQVQAQGDMLNQIGEATGGVAGVLKVGVSHMRGRTIMPGAMRSLNALYPDVSLHLVEGTNRELIHRAERAELDLIIASLDDSHPSIRVMPLYQEEVVLALRADLLESMTGMAAPDAVRMLSAEGLSPLRECPFLLESVDDIMGRIAYSELRNAGVNARVAAMSENLPTLLAMCADGLGAVFCSTNFLDVAGNLSEQLVRIPLSRHAHCTISLGLPLKTERWKALDALIGILTEQLRDMT